MIVLEEHNACYVTNQKGKRDAVGELLVELNKNIKLWYYNSRGSTTSSTVHIQVF